MENSPNENATSSSKNNLEEFIASLIVMTVGLLFIFWPTNSLKKDYERILNENIADFVISRLTCPLLDKESFWENEFDLRRAVEECKSNLQLSSDTYTPSTLREIEKKSFNQTVATCHEKKSDKKCRKLEQKLQKFIASPKYTQWIDSAVPAYLESKAITLKSKTTAASLYLEKYRGTKEWAPVFMQANDQFEKDLKETERLEKKVKTLYPFK